MMVGGKQMIYPQTAKVARREMQAAICQGAGSSASVAILEKGKIVYSEGFGIADREASRPVTPQTRFDVASISKVFSTAAMFALKDMSKLDIDKPICEYIHDFVMADPRYKKITARHLATHSSGLTGSCYNRAFCFEDYDNYQGHVLNSMRHARLKLDPGAKSSYCNDGFTLIEILIERITGQKYIDFLKEKILEPLGMKDTGVSVGAAGDVDAAELYHYDTRRKSSREVSPGVGMGGLSSTPEDMCRFGYSFCKGAENKVLSTESLAMMIAPQESAFVKNFRTRMNDIHFGWDAIAIDKYESRGVRVLRKGGLTWYATQFFALPDLDISVALSFAGSGPSQRPGFLILDALLEEKGYGSFKKPVKKPPKSEAIPASMRHFAGLYANGGAAVEIGFDKESISIKPITNMDAPAEYIHSNGYFYKKGDSTPTPHYFAKAGENSFFVMEDEHNALLAYQRTPYMNEPVVLDYDIDGKTWLNVNMHVRQFNWAGMFVVKSKLCQSLPGYVDFAGIRKIESGDYAKTAGTFFRDQKDLLLKRENGLVTAYCGDYVLVPEETARELAGGETMATVPAEGYNAVWYKTKDDYVIKIQADEKVTAHVISADGKSTVYASFIHGTDEFFASRGSYVVFYGKPGGKVKIQAE